MGNYRFRLSDMVPNAWFYKLKDMSRIRSKSQTTKKKQTLSSSLSSSTLSSSSNPQKTQAQQPHNMSYKRKSYYFSRNLNHETLSKNPTSNNTKFSEPPRKSSKKRRNNTKKKTSNVSAGYGCSLESVWTKHDSISTAENFPNSPFSFSSSTSSSEQESSVHSPKTFDALIMSKCKVHSDIVIDMRPMNKNGHGVDSVSKIDLPPIITKPKTLQDPTKGTKKNEETTVHKSLTVKIEKEAQSTKSPKRKVSVSSSNGVKLRTKSPRIVSRKSVSSSTSLRRSSVGESFAVVKSSQDPQKDFKESMVEMIVENNIRNSKGLEELLACYLSLNSDQYHDLIIKVFKQIWFDVTDIQ